MKKLVFVFAFLLFLPSSALAASQQQRPADGTMWTAFSSLDKMMYSSIYVEGRLAGELDVYNTLCSAGQDSAECEDIRLVLPYPPNPPKEDTVINIIKYLDKAYSNPQNTRLSFHTLVGIAYTASMERGGWEEFNAWVEEHRSFMQGP